MSARAPPQPNEHGADDPDAADAATSPAAVTHEPDGVLRDEHANRPARPGALSQGDAAFAPRGIGAGHAQGPRVAERAGIAATLASQGFSGGDSVTLVQPKGHGVERRIMVGNTASAAPDPGSNPVGELMQQRQALVDRVTA